MGSGIQKNDARNCFIRWGLCVDGRGYHSKNNKTSHFIRTSLTNQSIWVIRQTYKFTWLEPWWWILLSRVLPLILPCVIGDVCTLVCVECVLLLLMLAVFKLPELGWCPLLDSWTLPLASWELLDSCTPPLDSGAPAECCELCESCEAAASCAPADSPLPGKTPLCTTPVARPLPVVDIIELGPDGSPLAVRLLLERPAEEWVPAPPRFECTEEYALDGRVTEAVWALLPYPPTLIDPDALVGPWYEFGIWIVDKK